MASIAPPKTQSDLPLAPQAPALSSEPGPAAQAAQKRIAEYQAEHRASFTPDKIVVQLDGDAQRFVQTVTDGGTADVVLRYPSEQQLAYARAVVAYLRAQLAK